MNLDKTIKELTNRLDDVHPYSASYLLVIIKIEMMELIIGKVKK